MSYHEKRALLSFISIPAILGSYSLFVYAHYQDVILSNPNDFKFWGKIYLILISVSIVANIIIAIIFMAINKMITHENVPYFSDERDKFIELKAIRVSHWTFVIGFTLSMGSQAIGMQPWVMFITLAASGFFSATAAELTKFYLYRKGF